MQEQKPMKVSTTKQKTAATKKVKKHKARRKATSSPLDQLKAIQQKHKGIMNSAAAMTWLEEQCSATDAKASSLQSLNMAVFLFLQINAKAQKIKITKNLLNRLQRSLYKRHNTEINEAITYFRTALNTLIHHTNIISHLARGNIQLDAVMEPLSTAISNLVKDDSNQICIQQNVEMHFNNAKIAYREELRKIEQDKFIERIFAEPIDSEVRKLHLSSDKQSKLNISNKPKIKHNAISESVNTTSYTDTLTTDWLYEEKKSSQHSTATSPNSVFEARFS